MRFDVYGPYRIEVLRNTGRWDVFRLDDGKRRLAPDIIIPCAVNEDELASCLEDILHELSLPGRTLRRIS